MEKKRVVRKEGPAGFLDFSFLPEANFEQLHQDPWEQEIDWECPPIPPPETEGDQGQDTHSPGQHTPLTNLYFQHSLLFILNVYTVPRRCQRLPWFSLYDNRKPTFLVLVKLV